MFKNNKFSLFLFTLLLGLGLVLSKDKTLQEGENAFKAKDYDKAIAIFREIFFRSGIDVSSETRFLAALRLGECYLALKKNDDAFNFFNIALQGKGDIKGEALIGLGVVYLAREDYLSAIDRFSQVINQYKSDKLLAYAYYNRGLAYKGMKWMSKALSDLRSAKKKAKGDDELIKAIDAQISECQSAYGKFKQGEAYFLACLQTLQAKGDNDGCAFLLRDLARFCEDSGEMESAIDYEKQAISYSSSDEFKAGSWMNIGWRYFKIKDYENAAIAFQRIVEEYPNSSYPSEALLCLGDTLSNAGKTKDAIATYNLFFQRYPQDGRSFNALLNIANQYTRLGIQEKAGEYFLKAAEAFPQNPQAKEAIKSSASAYSSAKDYESALNIYKLFLEKYPPEEDVMNQIFAIARSSEREGEMEKAKNAYLMINQYFPNTELAFYSLAKSFEIVGEEDKALEAYERALSYNGKRYTDILYDLALLLYKKGNYEEASSAFNQLLSEYDKRKDTSAKRWEAIRLIGRCLENQMDFPKAINFYSQKIEELRREGQKQSVIGFNVNKYRIDSLKLRIAYCYLQLGDYDKANEIWGELGKEQKDYLAMEANELFKSYKEVIKPARVEELLKERKRETLLGDISIGLSDFLPHLHRGLIKGDLLIVYGTGGSKEEQSFHRRLAGRIKWNLKLSSYKSTKIVSDTAVKKEEIVGKHIIIIGTPASNEILKEIGDKLPIKIGENELEVGNRIYKGKDLALVMLSPNPFDEKKFAIILATFNPTLYDALFVFNALIGDYAILSAPSAQYMAFYPSHIIAGQIKKLETGYFLKLSRGKWIPFNSEGERREIAVKEEAPSQKVQQYKWMVEYLNGNYDEALKVIKSLLDQASEEMSDNDKWSLIWHMGRCYEHKLDFANALKCYEQLLPLSSKLRYYEGRAILFIGYCYLQMGNVEKAISTWEKGLDIGYSDEEGYYHFPQLIRSYREVIGAKNVSVKREGGNVSRVIGPIGFVQQDLQRELEEGNLLVIYGTQGRTERDINVSREVGKKLCIYGAPLSLATLKSDIEVSEKELRENNIYLVSLGLSNKVLARIKDNLPIKIEDRRIKVKERKYEGDDLGLIALFPSPFNKEKFLMIFLAYDPALLRHILNVPFQRKDYIIFSSESLGFGEDVPVLEEGYFLKLSPTKWEVF
ncbi:tetratricopeptide repeat protein [bacterium]|nr:tetratricopeptide repeat protein [bacterium]